MSRYADDDPLYFEQLLGAAVNMKHAFDLGRMDVINGTIKPRNTSLCHECITTVSSVWRSGPAGPRTLCNACGLRYYKQNQRRALEAKRRELKDLDAASSLAALGSLDVAVVKKLLMTECGGLAAKAERSVKRKSSGALEDGERAAGRRRQGSLQAVEDGQRGERQVTLPSIANLCAPAFGTLVPQSQPSQPADMRLPPMSASLRNILDVPVSSARYMPHHGSQ
ncbi:hypothetical protein DL89DRAFT_23828 [Linderina pennispora]|uniref:GATA-type domain-containing protein n=1 Tax=Linderina pennispora TaxID=61395 RepID=A0A1Y1WMU1_9FUNG|nr:uncharacterized protein DL89DRAFT_23828 [Linderina pennispora]ORX74861.1 hypothetical protein DL89DRAFT_23828 [Linderina pennispora]